MSVVEAYQFRLSRRETLAEKSLINGVTGEAHTGDDHGQLPQHGPRRIISEAG
jgi:hypothetical protein